MAAEGLGNTKNDHDLSGSQSVLEKAHLENLKKSYTNPFRLIFISCILMKDDQLECIHAVCLETK